MPAFTARSIGRSITRRFAPLLIMFTPLACDSQPVALHSPAEAALGAREPRGNGNPVVHWNTIASQLMLDPGPIMDSRAFAILHLAIHDAVNAIDRRYEPYTFAERSPGASLDAAVATAARDIIVALSPSQREKAEREYAAVLAKIPSGPSKDAGVRVGRRSAEANLARRANDGVPVGPWPPQTGPITQPAYMPNGKPGDYAFTPPFDRAPLGPIALFPGWGRLTPFGVDITKYKLPGPDALNSAAYAADLNQLKSVGSLKSRTRTADQAQTAFFWFEDFPVWHQIARQVVAQSQSDVWQTARAFAVAHIAVVDAGIACFEAKYRFRYWRPFTAIRRADEDDNPATQADKDWLPLLWTPLDVFPPTFLIPPIPEYPSAAAMVSAAAAEAMISLFGDKHSFEATSPTLPDVTRRYHSIKQAADEAGMSRVYGGIHFLRAVKDGAIVGQAIGREASRLLPPSK